MTSQPYIKATRMHLPFSISIKPTSSFSEYCNNLLVGHHTSVISLLSSIVKQQPEHSSKYVNEIMPLTYSKLYSNFHSIQNKNLIFWFNAPYMIHPHSKCSSPISFRPPLFYFVPVTLFFTFLNMLTQFCLTGCVPTVSFVQTIPALDLCTVFFLSVIQISPTF